MLMQLVQHSKNITLDNILQCMYTDVYAPLLVHINNELNSREQMLRIEGKDYLCRLRGLLSETNHYNNIFLSPNISREIKSLFKPVLPRRVYNMTKHIVKQVANKKDRELQFSFNIACTEKPTITFYLVKIKCLRFDKRFTHKLTIITNVYEITMRENVLLN